MGDIVSRLDQLQAAKSLVAQASNLLALNGGLKADPIVVALTAALAMVLQPVPDA